MININGDLHKNPVQISIPMSIQWDTRIKLAEPGLSCERKDRWQYLPIALARQKGRFSEPVHVWVLTTKMPEYPALHVIANLW